ncbi:hypothetical protein KAK06_12635 [Ideonella sp. 4Y11]|uniref:Secreted protein n=1 Tax=Ideonella aquatica TaxID=2824119 RepID=A0A941BR14_9BURK|nr:hypothetical protein [Ideonella aquatica]MBQ0959790.1 hypothetical protein [Ideonella aquatica]
MPARHPTPALALLLGALLAAPLAASAGTQIGASGKTFASDAWACALHPTRGYAPQVVAGLYQPAPTASAKVLLNGQRVARVDAAAPSATVWLANGLNSVGVKINKKNNDAFAFDAALTYPNQPNACIPDTSANVVAGNVETAASGKSYAVVQPGCARNPLTGRTQAFVNLFDAGTWLLNVSVNGVPLTQLNGTTRISVPVFLETGLNLITAANGTLSVDAYVRDVPAGFCL